MKKAIRGIWSGIPMPWKETEELDRAALIRTVKRCVEGGSHGIYVAGTTGEFHAMEEAQFRDVVETFTAAMRNHPSTGVQVGCGGFSLRHVCDRIETATANGCDEIQLPLPGWEPLDDDEVLGFFQVIAERFSAVRITVYDNTNCGRTIGDHLWPRLLEKVPSIVGAKLTSSSPELVQNLLAVRTDFNILAGEPNLISMWHQGARSLAAWISYAFPELIRALWDSLEKNDPKGIADGERKLEIIHRDIKDPMRSMGHKSGRMDRLMGMASGFLDPVYCRMLSPWRNVSPDHVSLAREKIVEHLGEEYLYRA